MLRTDDTGVNHWEMIFSSGSIYEAEIQKGKLEEEGIKAVIVNKQDSSYLAFGEIELFVLRDDVIRAKQIVERMIADE